MTEEFKIEPLKQRDTEALTKVLIEAFSSDQVEYEGGSQDEFSGYLHFMGTRCVESGLGRIARCNRTGQIIGGVLSCDLEDSFSSEEFQSDTHTDPMFAMLKKLNQQHFESFDIPSKEYLQIKFIGVDKKQVGKGIATALVNAAIAAGKEKGFKIAHAESAGSRSQHVFGKKCHFKVFGEVRYSDFSFQGKTPFKESPLHQSTQLMLKEI